MSAIGQHLRGNLVGYIALFVALSGTAYAAVNLPKNSVGTNQLKNGAVTLKKINPVGLNKINQSGPAALRGQKVVVRRGGVGTVSVASCKPGERAIAGGYSSPNGVASFLPATGSVATPDGGTPDGWRIQGNGADTVGATVVCVSP
jgi:hypothetical protein